MPFDNDNLNQIKCTSFNPVENQSISQEPTALTSALTTLTAKFPGATQGVAKRRKSVAAQKKENAI